MVYAAVGDEITCSRMFRSWRSRTTAPGKLASIQSRTRLVSRAAVENDHLVRHIKMQGKAVKIGDRPLTVEPGEQVGHLERAGDQRLVDLLLQIRKERQRLSRKGSETHKANAVSWSRRQWKHKAKAVSWPRRQWKRKRQKQCLGREGSGDARQRQRLGREGSGNTGQRRHLSREGRGNARQKAVPYPASPIGRADARDRQVVPLPRAQLRDDGVRVHLRQRGAGGVPVLDRHGGGVLDRLALRLLELELQLQRREERHCLRSERQWRHASERQRRYLEAFAEPAFKVLGRAEAAQPAADHNAHPGAEGLALLHAVGREHDGAVFVLLRDPVDHIPHEPPGDRIHPGRGLIQKYQRRPADRRNPDLSVQMREALFGKASTTAKGGQRTKTVPFVAHSRRASACFRPTASLPACARSQ